MCFRANLNRSLRQGCSGPFLFGPVASVFTVVVFQSSLVYTVKNLILEKSLNPQLKNQGLLRILKLRKLKFRWAKFDHAKINLK